MNNRTVGSQKEKLAVDFLRNNGLKIEDTNYRFHKMGEIDIIAKDGRTLVFAEVKYRKTARAGCAAQAVNYKKIKQICKVSDAYRACKGISPSVPIRFDVIAIDADKINWIKNAFPYAL